jgi:ATP phosphoribosyltransferase regulatory subunit
MSSAWVLPDHVADVLPSEARRIEELRRHFLDTARCYGYELVAPPLIEHLESLLTGTGTHLDLQTFKLVDQLSGRTLGVRADTTPQVARIDAHLLNRNGVCRLCYCGPVLHTRPERPYATREPMQLGAELYGHPGLEADLEVLELALSGLQAAQCQGVLVDFGHAQVLEGLLRGVSLSAAQLSALQNAVALKDAKGLGQVCEASHLSPELTQALVTLVRLHGGVEVLSKAKVAFAPWASVLEALEQLEWLVSHVNVPVSIDLAHAWGYAYYSGVRFAIYVQGANDALVRGGRYDQVGAVFGRARPAVGFSLDLKALVDVLPQQVRRAAVRAPWGEDAQLRLAVSQLRAQGETVVSMLPGAPSKLDEFECDRELKLVQGEWRVVAL